jgi:SanA protein
MRPSTRRALRRWFWLGVAGIVLFVLLCNRWVINSTDAYLYTDWALLPENDVGIVLGTSPFVRGGDPSTEFQGRIRAAAELYRLGKVRLLVVSGANPDSTYNEPRKMYQALVKAGVPESAIKMDFAGFRTLDSMVRAQTVWGQSRITVITQRYHTYRAIFLARKVGVQAVAFAAALGTDGAELGNRHPVREVFARAKAVLDLLILNTQPKFLGEPEHIEIPLREAAPGVEQ